MTEQAKLCNRLTITATKNQDKQLIFCLITYTNQSVQYIQEMLESLITSKTRIRILLKFFLNQQTVSHLRGLEAEFGESSNSIRLELLKLENAGLLSSKLEGNKKLYFANTNYPFFSEINSILKKTVGIDQIIEQITSQIGNLQAAYLTGDFAIGKDSQVIEMVLVGDHLDPVFIETLAQKADHLIQRIIKYTILTEEEMIQSYSNKPILLIWKSDTLNT